MNTPAFSEQVDLFTAALGLPEEPLGLYYTDSRPAFGFSPRPQTPLSQLPKENDGNLNWTSCLLGKLRRARREKAPAFFDEERYGCSGGAFFMGFKPDYEPFEPALLSTGIPGKIPGERYVDSPETGERFYNDFQPLEASGPVLVAQALSLFQDEERPELVIMFPNRKSLIGLNALTVFLTGDMNAVKMPFGVGCCTTVCWPRKFLAQGKTCAVVGGYDINMIKYLKDGELIYTVPYGLFLNMVEKWHLAVPGTKPWGRLMDKTS